MSGASKAEIALRTRQVAALLSEPSLVGEARENALQSPTPGATLATLRVHAQPDAGVVDFSLLGPTAAIAANIAAELVQLVAQTVRQTHPRDQFDALATNSFETTAEGWSATGTVGHVARIGLVRTGRYGVSGLRIACDASRGCGAASTTTVRFAAKQPFVTSFWARALRPSSIVMAFGAFPDRVQTKPILLRSPWRRVVVRWTPKKNESSAVFAIAATGKGPVDMIIDGVVLRTGTAPLSLARERHFFAQATNIVSTQPRVVLVRSGGTLRWALIGALCGALIGLAGVSAAWASGRRRQH